MILFYTVPSAAPESVEGQALGPRSLLLTWQPPPADQLNGILTGYIVNVTETETGTGNQYQIPADVTQFTFQGLHPFYRYTFIVAAVTVGQGPFSGIFSQQMSQDGMTEHSDLPPDCVSCIYLHVYSFELQPLQHHL